LSRNADRWASFGLRPQSGYDLKKYFESTFGHFFAAGYGSIYPALSSLSKQGFVSCEQIAQEGKPDRKVYQITEEGRQFLLKALENTSPCHKIRSEFLATMCFAHLMQGEAIEAVLDYRLEEIAKYREMFRQLEAESMSDWEVDVGLGKRRKIRAWFRQSHRHRDGKVHY
jgi:DNA-binding PadR family transcriptional regulator